jgi:hypothetical protein
MKHNGELRIAFHELVLPSGAAFRVDTTLKAIQAAESLNPSLDQEGGAKATNPKSRYITTGISVSLAIAGSGGKNDVGNAGPAAGGATALKLVGIAVGLAVRSHTLAILMSAYGGSRSIYTNFFGRGRNISFPRHLDGDRLRRSNRNSNAGPPLTVSVPDFAKTRQVSGLHLLLSDPASVMTCMDLDYFKARGF